MMSFFPLESFLAYFSESLNLSPPSLSKSLSAFASVDNTTFSFFSESLLFLSFLESFFESFFDFFSSFFSSFFEAFSAAISSSADLNNGISSKAHKISRTSASLAPTVPCLRSDTAKWSILSMRLILPTGVSQVAAWRVPKVRRLESFITSRSRSFLTFSAAFDSLMASAADCFFAFFFPPPEFFFFSLAASASASVLAA
mmetsp:Transcript_24495/g.40417  ORF Transcript_24495/g.40417 Transcript_24495/m.40417 type:complete len:200 (+) Transcript_24495:2178-2777(+)